MRWIYTLTLIVGQVASMASAARRVDAHVRARETLQERREANTLLRRRDEGTLDVQQLFQLSKGESMIIERQANDVLGTQIERLQEEYKGIPVFDGLVTVRANKNGQLTGDASGTIIQDIDEDLPNTVPNLTDEETLHIAMQAEGDDLEIDLIGDVSYKRWVYLDNKDKARLVNTVSYLIDSVKRPFYIIDVKNGEVLRHWNALNNFSCGKKKIYKAYGGNLKQGKIKYGDVPFCLNLTIVGDMCYLENDYVRVVDMKKTANKEIVETAKFKCKKGYKDKINDAYSPALDAFFYGTVVGKMFEEWFNSTALKDKIVLRVHYYKNYENAFWNGANCTFGDGFREWFPLTTLETVAHEIAHGVTEQASDLMYFDEFGGVNEAFSDIVGEAAEEYLSFSDLVVGRFSVKNKQFVRDFKNPGRDRHSIRKSKEMAPDLDPHYSSGVYRRVWYMIVEKKGMPVKDAARVFLHANRMYWHHAGTFYDCSCGVLRAAIDLGYSISPFRRAFKDVGIEDCDLSGHVLHLANNNTQIGVTVSNTINPIFKFKATNWTSSIIVDAVSSSGGAIRITVQSEILDGDGDTQNSATVLAEDYSHLEIMDMAGRDVLITLSSDDLEPHHDVAVTAGYTCMTSYDSYNWWLYDSLCGKKQ